MSGLTPFQTVGPFLHLGLRHGIEQATDATRTRSIVVHGRLLDGAAAGIPDGVLEFWAPGFRNLHRAWTGADGGYRLEIPMPQPRIEADGSTAAPHCAVRVMGRGILTEYLTRMYFEDVANERDAIWIAVPEDRRATLVAKAVSPGEYRFDIVVQGPGETVFFDV